MESCDEKTCTSFIIRHCNGAFLLDSDDARRSAKLRVQRNVNRFLFDVFSEATNAGIDTFVLEVDVETTALLVYQDSTTESYTNVVVRFDTTSSGGRASIWTFPTPNSAEGAINVVTYSKAGDMDSLTIELDFMLSDSRYVENVTITQQAQPFLWLGEGFPMLNVVLALAGSGLIV